MSSPTSDSDRDALETSIRQTLQRLEREVARAVDEGLLDDDVLDGMDADARQLEMLLDEADRAVRRLAQPEPLLLGKLAAGIFEGLLADVEKPLVLSVDWSAADEVRPTASRSAAVRGLRRLFEAVLATAVAGDRVSVRARPGRDGATVVVDVALAVDDPARADRIVGGLTDVIGALGDPAVGVQVGLPARIDREIRLGLELGDAVVAGG